MPEQCKYFLLLFDALVGGLCAVVIEYDDCYD